MLIISSVTFAEEKTLFQKLFDAKTIKCYLDKGAATHWKKGKLNIEIDKFSE